MGFKFSSRRCPIIPAHLAVITIPLIISFGIDASAKTAPMAAETFVTIYFQSSSDSVFLSKRIALRYLPSVSQESQISMSLLTLGSVPLWMG